jgi:hypothetical protein
LIIGEFEKYIDPAAPAAPAADAAPAPAAPAPANKKFSLKIKKIIFIVDDSLSVQENIAKDDLSKEEFLNLYYIDYFSFDNDKFTQKYTQFKTPSVFPGGSTLVKKKKKKAK